MAVGLEVITGSITVAKEAIIRLTVRGQDGQSADVEALIDTGFTDFLTLPPALIAALDLPWRMRGTAFLADGSEAVFEIHEAVVVWDGRPRRIPVATVDADPLVGMSLLEGYRLTVEVVPGGRVVIERLT